MDTILSVYDVKGDKGKVIVRGAADDRATALVTFLTGKSYVGGSNYSLLSTDVLASPKTLIQTEDNFNDIDVKCIIIYKDVSDPANQKTRRLSIPAPIINQTGGICAVTTNEKREVPAIPPSGADGMGGNSIITAWETACGATAGDFQFLSGAFVKSKD